MADVIAYPPPHLNWSEPTGAMEAEDERRNLINLKLGLEHALHAERLVDPSGNPLTNDAELEWRRTARRAVSDLQRRLVFLRDFISRSKGEPTRAERVKTNLIGASYYLSDLLDLLHSWMEDFDPDEVTDDERKRIREAQNFLERWRLVPERKRTA